ncbi:glutamate racemase [Neptuniibacter sp. 1_MG-2023]|jgi:glutamate racemase|uniref:glutamate racemase n=1 Tax=Neptuniibacter sp. 1_MG-2023 TaxID=3062662 RepID=UPI0026E25840|nr:glutamate racemase [Neptuniibacter sp. 1_MG-2023]MDO6594813.1 glutamate racemase [Neptuniibacter sp. 1_MG-2023]
MSLVHNAHLPIGVFDSGVGGLTVLNAIRQRLPNENLIYLGDTARVPYGTKSASSVTRYAEQAAKALIERKIKMLVIACNTASAVAIEPLQYLYPDIPVIGVVGPGAEASCDATQSQHIGVIATEGTVNNQAYQNAILKRLPSASVVAHPCSLFVALAEEGWHTGDLVKQIVETCLEPFKREDHSLIDTLVLGCTHFPALKNVIADVMGDAVSLVDSAETTANAVASRLEAGQLLNMKALKGDVQFLVTDGPTRFARVAQHFFSDPIPTSEIQLVDIQHFAH